jgi:TPR repeat protein
LEKSDVNLVYKKAKKLLKREQYSDAFSLYLELANFGDPKVHNIIGWMYFNGEGVEKNVDAAVKYFTKGADLNDPESEYFLCIACKSLEKYSESRNWCLKAANKSYSPAMYSLGCIYELGIGVEKDFEEAFQWFKKGARKGHVFAEKEYAVRLLSGKEGLVGKLKAIYFFLKICIQIPYYAYLNPNSENIRHNL